MCPPQTALFFYLAANGTAGKYANSIDSTYASLTGSSFYNGSSNTRPGEITVSVKRLASGDYKFIFTGNFVTGVNELSYIETAAHINTLFGTAYPKVYLNLTSEQSQVIHIESITTTASSSRLPDASLWSNTYGTGMTALDDGSDCSTQISSTSVQNAYRIHTTMSYKLDGLYISLTDVNYSAAGLPFMIAPTGGRVV